MFRRWRRKTSRRRARLKFKQQPMSETISPVRECSDQEPCPDSTTIPEHQHPQQPEIYDEPKRRDHTSNQLSIHGQVTQAVAELEGLSLKIVNSTGPQSEVVADKSDEDETDTEAGPEPTLEDPEEGSQTSSEESWASFPSSGSCSTDSSSSAGEDAGEEESEPGSGSFMSTAPDAETTFKFHEEFSSGESSHSDVDDDNDGSEPPSRTLPPLPPPPPLVEDDEEEEIIYSPPPPPPGPWSVCAVPRWAFLESSDSLPTLGLGPEDFYHGGSSLRHEVSADKDEDVDDGSDEEADSRMSQDISSIGVVHL